MAEHEKSKYEAPKYQSNESIWEILKNGVPNNSNILSVRGTPKQLEEAKKLLESQERLRGIEVAKW